MPISIQEQTCCFTGHRYLSFDEYHIVQDRLEQTLKELIASGVRYFGAGGALGFDTIAAQTILKLRKEHPQIKLILVLPCISQTQGWKKEDVVIYESIKQQADKITYTSKQYTQGCMQKRNRHLVDHSSICVCWLKKKSGGTAYTVHYAKQKGLMVINLADQ